MLNFSVDKPSEPIANAHADPVSENKQSTGEPEAPTVSIKDKTKQKPRILTHFSIRQRRSPENQDEHVCFASQSMFFCHHLSFYTNRSLQIKKMYSDTCGRCKLQQPFIIISRRIIL